MQTPREPEFYFSGSRGVFTAADVKQISYRLLNLPINRKISSTLFFI